MLINNKVLVKLAPKQVPFIVVSPDFKNQKIQKKIGTFTALSTLALKKWNYKI